ncbi:MAG: PAS domain S-box protein [Candidatus Omnitrophica bacterium]|nr:PAS domain S-box protein [Candidatus Omnitrophota bacterium]
MANHSSEKKELYARIRSEGITIDKNVWNFMYHRVNENITAIILICQRWLGNREAMPTQEAERILARIQDIKNAISALTVPLKESSAFPQFQDVIPINSVVKELITHQFGNDMHAIELILQDAVSLISPVPVPLGAVQKIIDHTQAIKGFLEKFSDVVQWEESEEKYRNLYYSFQDGLVMTDLKGHILEVNLAYSNMLNYTAEEIKKLTYQQLTPERWHKIEEVFVNDLIAKKVGSVEYEKECIKKDGTVFPIGIKVWLIQDKQGNPLGIWGIVRDITERKKAQREFEEEILASHAVIDNIGIGLSLSDKKGRFVIFNSGMQKITGYTMEEINKQGLDVVLYPDLKERQKAISRLSEITPEKGISNVETIIKVKDSSERTVSVSTSLIKYKGSEMFLSIWHDITEYKRLQEALQDSETRFRRLFEAAQDGILILKADTGEITEVNKFLVDLLGYSREEFLGRKLWEIGAFIDVDKSKVAFRELQTKGYVRYEDMPLQTKAGRLIDVEFVSNVYEVDHTRVIQCNIRNITEFKAERERMNKKLEQLALKDSHTGLYNHRYLKEAIGVNFSQTERRSSLLSVIMMDLDYFKSINDVYGHVFGDLVLKQFAMLLTKTVRPYDVVIRYGGEEFIIISPDTDRAGALILANRILENIQLHNFGNKKHSIRLKLSLAVATYPEDDVHKGMELVDLADQILNKVKESGGNRVFSSTDIKITSKSSSQSPDIHLLKEKISRLTKRADQSLIEETLAFAKALELKDHYTGEHVERTVHYAIKLSQELKFSSERSELIRQAATLHDVGKVGISEKILQKNSRLSKKEFEEVKKHPQIGVDIIRPIHSLHPVIPALLYHHERWDGKGYPYGLSRQQIPLMARIVSVAAVYQALVSDRPYRNAYPKEEAIEIIQKSSGTQFDPDIVNSFLKVLQEEK